MFLCNRLYRVLWWGNYESKRNVIPKRDKQCLSVLVLDQQELLHVQFLMIMRSWLIYGEKRSEADFKKVANKSPGKRLCILDSFMLVPLYHFDVTPHTQAKLGSKLRKKKEPSTIGRLSFATRPQWQKYVASTYNRYHLSSANKNG